VGPWDCRWSPDIRIFLSTRMQYLRNRHRTDVSKSLGLHVDIFFTILSRRLGVLGTIHPSPPPRPRRARGPRGREKNFSLDSYTLIGKSASYRCLDILGATRRHFFHNFISTFRGASDPPPPRPRRARGPRGRDKSRKGGSRNRIFSCNTNACGSSTRRVPNFVSPSRPWVPGAAGRPQT